MVSLIRDDGEPVPAGAAVEMDGLAGAFAVAPGGEAYLTGLDALSVGVASWQGGSCAFAVHYPDTGALQPRLGPLACMEGKS